MMNKLRPSKKNYLDSLSQLNIDELEMAWEIVMLISKLKGVND